MAISFRFFVIALVAIVCFGFVNNAEAEIREVGSLDIPMQNFIDIAVVRNTAFIASWNGGIKTVDVSDLAQLRLLELYVRGASEVEIMGNYTFSGSMYNNTGLQIFFLDSLIYSGEPYGIHSLLLEDSLLYVTTAVQSVYMLYIFNVINPAEPALIGQLEVGFSRAEVIIRNHLYMNYGYGINIFDVSNPAEPEWVRNVDPTGWITDIATDGEYCFVTTQTSHGRDGCLQIRTWDWELVSDFRFYGPTAIKFHQGYLYVTSNSPEWPSPQTRTIRVFNISNPETPELIDSFNSGRNSVDLWFDSDLCYVIENGDSLYDDGETTSRLLILNVEIDDEEEVQPLAEGQPKVFLLNPAYPNPFNSTTRISFNLPQAGAMNLNVFDIEGREVRQIINGSMPAGVNTVTFDGLTLPTGAYFLRLSSPNGEQRLQKIILWK